MALESATYIVQLVPTNPIGRDALNTADDHLRLLKNVLQNQFTSLGAQAVTVTATEINYLSGVSSNIQTQFAAKAPTASPALTGTPTVPTAAAGTGTTQAASCAFVQAAIANVNANGQLTVALDSSASVTGVAGQHTICTNAAQVTYTLPAGPTTGNKVRVAFTNSLYNNIIDPGAEKIRGVASTRSVNAKNAEVELTYTGATYGWSY